MVYQPSCMWLQKIKKAAKPMHRKWWRTSILLPGHGVSTCYSRDWSQRLKFLQNASTSKCFRHQQNKPLTIKNSSTKLIHLPSTSSPPPSLPKKKSGPLRTSAEILGAVLEVEASQPPEAPRHQKIDGCQKGIATLMPKQQKFPVLSMVLTCSGWWL